MSMQSFQDFFRVFGNSPDLVQQFRSVNSPETGFNFMVAKGRERGYSFTTDDVKSGLLDIKLKAQLSLQQHIDSHKPLTVVFSPEAFRRMAETRSITSDMGDVLGWEDGELGATIGETLYSYWDNNSDNWGVASPDASSW